MLLKEADVFSCSLRQLMSDQTLNMKNPRPIKWNSQATKPHFFASKNRLAYCMKPRGIAVDLAEFCVRSDHE